MPTLSADTSVMELLEEYPFLVGFLASYNGRFRLLKNPLMRATAGRVATLARAAEMGGVELDELMEAIRGEVERRRGQRGPGGDPRGEKPGPPGRDRGAELKELLRDLHAGLPVQEARTRFDGVVGDISPKELGAIEEELIREGLPVEEIQRLCDLHVSVVRGALDKVDDLVAVPGHPAHTCMAENEVITSLANRLGELCAEGEAKVDDGPDSPWREDVQAVVNRLSGIHNHYLRKENELFSVLERHGITGPSQVMWGVHDEIRGVLGVLKGALASGTGAETAKAGASLARAVIEMVYKENRILLPLAMEALSEEEWAAVRRGEDELGYAFVEPSPAPEESISLPVVPPGPPAAVSDPETAYVDLGTGRLTLEQVDMILRHLPVDLSFVDAEGFVRYYSETSERLFPRTPGAIGRHVTHCHPPKSVHMVEEILAAFASGERDVAEFWIQMKGRFIHIRYLAVRNPEGAYLGCLEVSQDVTAIRELEGERRLLEWS